METKVCSKCSVCKDIDAFGWRKSGRDRKGPPRRETVCLSCLREYKRNHREQNKEHYDEMKSAYTEEHREEIAAYKKQWAIDNEERLKEKRKVEYYANVEMYREKSKKYAKTEVGKIKRKETIERYLSTEEGKEKHKCRSIVNAAIRSRKLIRPTICSRCKIECKPQAHHVDYNRPLEVTWLCVRCHEKEHHLNEG